MILTEEISWIWTPEKEQKQIYQEFKTCAISTADANKRMNHNVMISPCSNQIKE
jgi:hypothetical protein